MKKLYKDASGSRQSAVEEEKALALAQKRLAEAEHKVIAVKRCTAQLQKDYHVYKGAVQRFTSTVEVEVPNAAAHLDNLVEALQAYVAAGPEIRGSTASAASSEAPAVTRGDVDEPPRPARDS